MEIFEFLETAKYFVIGLGAIGIIVLIAGLFKQQRQQIVGGLLIILAAAVIAFCGYLIYNETEDRIYKMMEYVE